MGIGYSEDRLPILMHQEDEMTEERHHQCNAIYMDNNNRHDEQHRNNRLLHKLLPNDFHFRSWLFGHY